MIYQPRAIQPTHMSIDGNEVGEISMVMNTSNYIDAYALTIYNMDNTIFYQGEKTDFPNALYNGDTGFINLPLEIGLQNGTDYKWVSKLYQPTADMLITYGNVVDPKTYVYVVPAGGLTSGSYYFNVGDKTYTFTTTTNLSQNDELSFNSNTEIVTQYYGTSSIDLLTTALISDNFRVLAGTQSGSTYTYTVEAGGLMAGDYKMIIGGVVYWFTTLSDLNLGDYISYDSATEKITQSYNSVVISLNYIKGSYLVPVQSLNTITKVYLKKNINIKSQMLLTIGEESKTIYSYDINTGLAVVDEPFTNVPNPNNTYYVYSDFIETTPENILYVRALPVVSISNFISSIPSKEYTFIGSYSQLDNVPLVYYKWDLYSVNDAGSTLVKTTGKIYSANIQFYYDGFKNGETYKIDLTVETEFGVQVSTGGNSFMATYDILSYDNQPTAVQTEEQGIRVSWTSQTSTEPYSININLAKGLIQGDLNTSSVIWLEQGKNVPIGSTIIVGENEARAVVGSYDANTGKTILSTPLNYIPSENDAYYVYAEPNYNLNGINILRNMPYLNSNSAKIGDNKLIYQKAGGMAIWPEEYQLTMQFLLDEEFFLNNNSIYNNMIPIARYNTDDLYDLLIFVKDYNFCAIKPSMTENELDVGTVIEPPIYIYTAGANGLVIGNYYFTINSTNYNFTTTGDLIDGSTLTFNINNPTTIIQNIEGIETELPIFNEITGTEIELAQDTNNAGYIYISGVVLNNQKYLCFVNYDYIECISSYDENTGKVVFEKNLPEEYLPVEGDIYYLYDTVEGAYYNNPRNIWLLSATEDIDSANDYVWDDNSVWDDNYFWLEGGGQIGRATNNWWKIKIKKSEILIGKGEAKK